jgi:branched-chain amino acid transport system permease protein
MSAGDLAARRSVWIGNMPKALAEAAIAALIAVLAGIPFLGLHLANVATGLTVEPRWKILVIAGIVVFFGRLAMALVGWGIVIAKPRRNRVATEPGCIAFRFGLIAAVMAVLLPVFPFADRYVIDLATTVLIYVMLGWGLGIVVGLAGLLDLGYVGFYAIGAYSYVAASLGLGWPFFPSLLLAGFAAASAGILLGFPVLRLRGDYLAIVTLGFGEIIRIVLLNAQDLTGGPNGITQVPRPSFFGLSFSPQALDGAATFHETFGLEYSPHHRLVFLYYLILALALVTNWFSLRARKLPLGRAWEALREDETACAALGVNTTNTKLTAFAVGAMFAGFAGSFFAARQGFISPESFTFTESAVILAIVVLGGMGSQLGAMIAATLLIVLPEIGREFADVRMLLFGLAMMGIMVVRPQGLVSKREPSLRMHLPGAAQ